MMRDAGRGVVEAEEAAVAVEPLEDVVDVALAGGGEPGRLAAAQRALERRLQAREREAGVADELLPASSRVAALTTAPARSP